MTVQVIRRRPMCYEQMYKIRWIVTGDRPNGCSVSSRCQPSEACAVIDFALCGDVNAPAQLTRPLGSHVDFRPNDANWTIWRLSAIRHRVRPKVSLQRVTGSWSHGACASELEPAGLEPAVGFYDGNLNCRTPWRGLGAASGPLLQLQSTSTPTIYT
ncbi:unnamed protein product [Nesidiocoris tenuis]|uniref:Uncharacterized protein n=1 Tax=Nesidiocoris tenuis TaxID=355587 RepID=A0A6H5GDT8_9HEMI|nr:unnamed protein product [Nesidiocoris tenuis]